MYYHSTLFFHPLQSSHPQPARSGLYRTHQTHMTPATLQKKQSSSRRNRKETALPRTGALATHNCLPFSVRIVFEFLENNRIANTHLSPGVNPFCDDVDSEGLPPDSIGTRDRKDVQSQIRSIAGKITVNKEKKNPDLISSR